MPRSTFAVTVIGRDRPGIVATVSRCLYELGCNLEDVSSTILRGHFSMVLIVDAPEQRDIQTELRRAADEVEASVWVRQIDDAHGTIPEPTHVVSVYGADRPGIVYRVTERLADIGANITDLNSRVIGADEEPVYALMLEVASPGLDLASAVEQLRDELGVEISVRRRDADVF